MAIMESLGAILGTVGSLTQQQNSQNSAASANAFSEHMSNTSYQRAVADLNAAGLSPMLAYERGGASTPSGAMSPMAQQNAGELALGGQAQQTARQAQEAQLQAVQSSVELNSAQADKAAAEAAFVRTQDSQFQSSAESERLLRSKQGTLATSSAGAADASVQEITKRLDVMDSQLKSMGMERDQMTAFIAKLQEEKQLIAAQRGAIPSEMQLRIAQTAAAYAGAKLSNADALKALSLVGPTIENLKAVTELDRQSFQIRRGETGAVADIKPWLGVAKDVTDIAGNVVGMVKGGAARLVNGNVFGTNGNSAGAFSRPAPGVGSGEGAGYGQGSGFYQISK